MSTTQADITLIPLADIHVDWQWNCRGGEIKPADVFELMESIKTHGLLQPVIVIEHPGWKENPGNHKFLLVIGHRRYRAHQLLGLTSIRALVQRGVETEEAAVTLNFVENLSRLNLTIPQEVMAVARLLKLGLNRDSVAERLHMSQGWVQVRTMLMTLPAYVAHELQEGFITQPQVRRLYTIYIAKKKTEGETEAEDALISAIKKLKDAKLTGKKRDPLTGEEEALRASSRPRKEIFRLQQHIYNNVGAGLTTKALAWAAGEITEKDLEEEIKEECRLLERIYVPQEG